MSRAAWVTLICVGAAAGLTIWLLTRPLPDDAKSQATAAVSQLEKAEAALRDQETQLDGLVAQDSSYLAGRPEVKRAKAVLAERARVLKEARDLADGELKKLLDKNSHGDRSDVYVLADAVAKPTQAALTNAPLGDVKRVLGYKTNHAQLLEGARAAVSAAAAVLGQAEPAPGACDDDAAQAGYQMAVTAYPEAKKRLDARLAALKDHARQISKSSELLERAAARKPLDYALVGQQAEALTLGGEKLATLCGKLVGARTELSRSIDRILADMKTENGRHSHKYKIIEDGAAREGPWTEVDAAFYKKHENDLGMTLFSKPAGVLEEDAVEVASPPGFNYVGNNRYGRWDGRGTTRHWIFYPRYGYMPSLFWGPMYYHPIYYSSWSRYDTYRHSRRPYYGSRNQYGTRGSITRRKYSGSRYMRNEGSRTRRATGGKRSGSGYRSSRYRSSSRSGGGK